MYSLLLLYLYYYSSGYPRSLHPFPTRRSSDLDAGPLALSSALPVGKRKKASGVPQPSTISRRPSPSESRITVEPSVSTFRLDRKSTRLNSSHTVISYAVFCLKKKKTI